MASKVQLTWFTFSSDNRLKYKNNIAVTDNWQLTVTTSTTPS